MDYTSYIAEISYKIENLLYRGYSIKEIQEMINSEQKKESSTFPKNLVLINAYYDKVGGSSGCAFLDTNTGETIIGFAGTNLDNGWIETSKDFLADGVGLGLSGINPDSLYMGEANKFINDLKKDGYNITQATGHSLGGSLCAIVGLNHDIPLVVTYNGAPLYALSTAELTGVADKLEKLYSNYNGRILRFVSDEDELNLFADSIDGLYYGDEYMLYNGRGHDIEYFKFPNEQTFIAKVIQTTLNTNGSLSVDFEGDNVIDIYLSEQDLYVKNLFGTNGLYTGNGTDMKIDPQSFYTLQHNLSTGMANDDFSWIKDTITKCNNKNETLKANKGVREDDLIQRVVEGLNQAQLPDLLSGIEESHGKLSEHKNTIYTLANFDTYSVTRNFDRWGDSSGRRWFLDGEEFEEYMLINWIKDLKESASVLYHQMTSTGEFRYFDSYSRTYKTYKYDTISEIGSAYVSVTNAFLSKTKKVFQGTGLRSGKKDGIVNAISEVLDFELKNVEEMKKKVESLADIAGGLADNFSSMDVWLKDKIVKGESVSGFIDKDIPKDYEAYLIENEIFDDVKDVLEAYDLQVEEATAKLSKTIVTDFTDIVSRSYDKLSTIYTYFETFIKSVNYLQEKLNRNVTSTRTKSILNGYNQWETTEIKDYHGNLSDTFSWDVMTAINNAKNKVNPILPNFTTSLTYIGAFNTQINYIKEYFNTVIEQAVYNSLDLDTIINAQMLISLRIKRMKDEIVKINESIQAQYKGKSLNSYQDKLSELINLYTYFDSMLNDCFGINNK